jgi:hypothetical protein
MITWFPTRTSLDPFRQQTGRKPSRGKCVPPKHSIHIEVDITYNRAYLDAAKKACH